MQSQHIVSIQLKVDPARRFELLQTIQEALESCHAAGVCEDQAQVAMYLVQEPAGYVSHLGWL